MTFPKTLTRSVLLTMATIAAPALAAQPDKPSLFGNPAQLFRDAQHPAFAPPPYAAPSPYQLPQQPQPAISVPCSQIGLQNSSSSNVAAVIEIGNGQSRVVLLKAHEYQTVDCRNCSSGVKAIVPRGSTPKPDDFTMTVSPGTAYGFEFDSLQKRWTLQARQVNRACA